LVHRANDLDEIAGKPDLFFRLAQRRGGRVDIFSLPATAGKGDLAGMTRHVLGALR
jgi:hypothetical protein